MAKIVLWPDDALLPLPGVEVEGIDLVADYWLCRFSIQIEPHSGFEFQTPSATFLVCSGAL